MNKRKILSFILVGGFILSPLILANTKTINKTLLSGPEGVFTPSQSSQSGVDPISGNWTKPGGYLVDGSSSGSSNNSNNGNSVPSAFQGNDNSMVQSSNSGQQGNHTGFGGDEDTPEPAPSNKGSVPNVVTTNTENNNSNDNYNSDNSNSSMNNTVPDSSSNLNDMGTQSNGPSKFNNYNNTGDTFTFENWSKPYTGHDIDQAQVAKVWDQYKLGSGNNSIVPMTRQSFYGFNSDGQEPVYYNYSGLADPPYINKTPIIQTLGNNKNQFMSTRGYVASQLYDSGERVSAIQVGQYVKNSLLSDYFNTSNYDTILSFMYKDYTKSFKNNSEYRQQINVTTNKGLKETLVYGIQNGNQYVLAYPTNNDKGIGTLLTPNPVKYINLADKNSFSDKGIMNNSNIEYLSGTNMLSTFITNPTPSTTVGTSLQAYSMWTEYGNIIVPQIQDVYKINSLVLPNSGTANIINLNTNQSIISGLPNNATLNIYRPQMDSSNPFKDFGKANTIYAVINYNGNKGFVEIPYTVNSSLKSNQMIVNGKTVDIVGISNSNDGNTQVKPNLTNNNNSKINNDVANITANVKPKYLKDTIYVIVGILILLILSVSVIVIKRDMGSKNRNKSRDRFKKGGR